MSKYLINHPIKDMSDFKIVLTDPKSGKQLRIFCENVKLVSENYFRGIIKSSLELEYFCDNLEYSEKNP